MVVHRPAAAPSTPALASNEKVWPSHPTSKLVQPGQGSSKKPRLTRYCGLSDAPRHALRHGVRANATSVASSALRLLSQPVGWSERKSSGFTGAALEVTLHQIIPALVRQLSSGEELPEACLQLVHQSSKGQLDIKYKNLHSPDTSASEVWNHVKSSSSHDALSMVVLARPIPDPSLSCPMSPTCNTPPASSASQTASSSHSHNTHAGASRMGCGIMELEGAVDLDGCCGGKGPSARPHHAATAQATASHVDSRSPDMRQMATAVQAAAATVSSCAAASSSASCGAGNGTFMGLPHLPQPVAPVASRSRRRFLRRQSAAQAQGTTRSSSWGASAQPYATNQAQQSSSSYSASGSHAQTTFWGLAVQDGLGRAGPDHDHVEAGERPWCKQGSPTGGCYVLKMTRNRDFQTGCTCTVFSLTRVCRGQPLNQQLQDAWLAF